MAADIEFNIEQMLQSERAWEFVLLDIVQSEELDPWDIDITKLTAKYTERVNKMKQLDLRIPARLILAAAILLKMQSDRLVLSEGREEFADSLGEGFEDDDMFDQPDAERKVMDDVPDLNLTVRRKHIRPITLADLINKLKRSIDPPLPRGRRMKFHLDIPDEDITEQIENLYTKVISHSFTKVPFSKLTENMSRRQIIDTFLPLLHLANDHRVDLHQENFFEEIYVEQLSEEERNRRLTLKSDEHVTVEEAKKDQGAEKTRKGKKRGQGAKEPRGQEQKEEPAPAVSNQASE